jgi:hypothetical protein
MTTNLIPEHLNDLEKRWLELQAQPTILGVGK